MVDFPVCPSSERTMSVLTPFRRGFMKTGRFYCKVVSANLFADSLSVLKHFTAQSLRRFAPAPFAQGSPCRIPHPNHCPNSSAIFNLSVCRIKPICKLSHISYLPSPRSCYMAVGFKKRFTPAQKCEVLSILSSQLTAICRENREKPDSFCIIFTKNPSVPH